MIFLWFTMIILSGFDTICDYEFFRDILFLLFLLCFCIFLLFIVGRGWQIRPRKTCGWMMFFFFFAVYSWASVEKSGPVFALLGWG